MSTQPKIVYGMTHPWVEAVVREVAATLIPHADLAFYDVGDQAAATRLLPEADFLVCLKLPPAQARLLRRCQLVHHNGVGYDGIDQQTLHEMGIPLCITPALTPEGVAEHTLMLMLALSKQLIPAHNSIRQGGFNMLGWREGSHTLFGKTVSIVGLGRIGKRVAHLARAFGCRVLYNDLIPAPAALADALELERVDLETAVSQADILTAHVPLTPLTHQMFTATQFAHMPTGSLFINTCRGETYSLDDLHHALTAGHLRGAGLDVFAPEPPPPNHPILQLPNVICTPHIASGTVERQYAIVHAQLSNFLRVLAGNPPQEKIIWNP